MSTIKNYLLGIAVFGFAAIGVWQGGTVHAGTSPEFYRSSEFQLFKSREHVAPIFVAGNPSCATLNADSTNFPNVSSNYGFKLDDPENGTFAFTNADGVLTGGAPELPGSNVTISGLPGTTPPGETFNWTSNIAITAVIVKGGPNANGYPYNLEFGDTGLHAPVGPSGSYYGVSHIEFCFEVGLLVEKTAVPSFTRTFPWEIEKSVDPTVINMFTGDSSSVEYEVVVTKGDPIDSDFAVSGTITITNDTGVAATITGVTDVITHESQDPINVDVECGVTFPYVLSNGGVLNCTYETDLPDGEPRTNTANVTTTGSPNGGGDAVDFDFDGDPTTVVNDSVNIDDTWAGDLGEVSDDTTFTYPRTFSCDVDEGDHPNTATIVETEQEASASVTVNCYQLAVTKNANTSLTRTWDWDIEKRGPGEIEPVGTDQPVILEYEVEVTGSYTDSNWAVAGDIDVYNPAPIAATINSVTDVVSPAIAAVVNCGVMFPYSLAAGGTLECTYSAALPDASDRTNTATATLQNYADGVPSGTTPFTGNAAVSFLGALVNSIDECVDVYDNNGTPADDTDDVYLGEFCAAVGNQSYTFDHTITVSYPDCGEYEVTNIARFVSNDTEAEGSDSQTVDISVPCASCVRSPGYWRTHAKSLFVSGPPYDATWDEYKFAPVLEIHNNFAEFYLSGNELHRSYVDSPGWKRLLQPFVPIHCSSVESARGSR
jgi:hypothetical protein